MNLSRLKKLNILYAEDDHVIRQSIEKSLTLLFAKVYVAKDGAEAIELFDNHDIDIALLDYVMPQKDAYEVLKHIRGYNASLPVIILSAYTDKEKLFNAIGTKVVEYLEKPVNEQSLMDALIKHSSSQEELDSKEVYLSDDTFYSFKTKSLFHNENEVTLTHHEVEILECFIRNKGRIISKDTFYEKLNIISDGTLRNCISSLRKKLPDNTIATKKSLGYILS